MTPRDAKILARRLRRYGYDAVARKIPPWGGKDPGWGVVNTVTNFGAYLSPNTTRNREDGCRRWAETTLDAWPIETRKAQEALNWSILATFDATACYTLLTTDSTGETQP